MHLVNERLVGMLLINGVVFKEVQFPWNAPRNNKPSQGPQCAESRRIAEDGGAL